MTKQYKRKKRNTKKKSTSKNSSFKKMVVILLFIIAVSLGIYFIVGHFKREAKAFESEKYFVKGIDVSHHNATPSWDEVMNQGISFAYIKATEGNIHLDRNYNANYDLAKAAKIKVGSYHFYTFGMSGKEQAEHFISVAQNLTGDLIPAIDVEHSRINVYSSDTAYISLVVRELKALEKELTEYFGIRPIIYTNKECYRLYIKKHFPSNAIWMCDLHNEPNEDDVPNWKIWQFSHKGRVTGIQGKVDLNYYKHSFAEFKELLLP